MTRARRSPARPEPRLAAGARPRPARAAGPRPRREGGLARFVRRLLGIRRPIVVDGVRYREDKPVSLERAIGSPRHKGKRYTVSFPDAPPMPITATRERRYADLMDVPELRSVRLAEPLVRPGSRVLILGGGTGGLAAAVAAWVGPHGGVVSIEHDSESVRFARRRYPLAGVSVERGGVEALAGELDASFDAVVVAEPWLRKVGQGDTPLREAWRLTRQGGRLLAIGDAGATTAGEYFGFDPGPTKVSKRTPDDGGPAVLVIERPEPRERRDRSDPGD